MAVVGKFMESKVLETLVPAVAGRQRATYFFEVCCSPLLERALP